MSKQKGIFKWIYLAWLILLIGLTTAAVLHVNNLLGEYEAAQPERQVKEIVSELTADAAGGDFWGKYGVSRPQPGKFEAERDVEKTYLSLYQEGELEFAQKNTGSEDELSYIVKNGGTELAEIRLKAAGPMQTKLAVFSMREWELDYVKPLLEKQDYTLTVPADFRVRTNGIDLTDQDGVPKGAEIEYTVSGLYLNPEFEITDSKGELAAYTVKNGKVMVEYCDYDLTLPAALTVRVDGKVWEGTPTDRDRVVHYDIAQLSKPEVEICDYYGNVFPYAGESKIPLTYAVVTVDERFLVQVDGMTVPPEAAQFSDNADYEQFIDYVPNAPRIAAYQIAMLKDDAEISVFDLQEEPVAFEAGEQEYDFTALLAGEDEIPGEIRSEVNVLELAQTWSLFMSDDLEFEELEQYLIPGSYQHDVAKKYATGVDITFTSAHTLLDPAFTENSVTNFLWITKDAFSADISFVKRMQLPWGKIVEDPMNDRFYFVRHEGAWKLASMKEILSDAGA